METLHEIIKDRRLKKNLLIKDIAHQMKIDSTLWSRYEKGERLPAEKNLEQMATILGMGISELKKYWLAEKIFEQIKAYPEAGDVLTFVEEKMSVYIKSAKVVLGKDIKKLLQELDVLKKEIKKNHPLNETQLKKLQEYFNISYTYESNRIEGNTLSLQETALVVNKGITIAGKSMREHLEAINHSEALEYIQDVANSKTEVTERLIKELHYLVLKTIDKENAGQYRRSDVRITGSRHVPVAHYDVALEMQKLIRYYNTHKNTLHPVLLAADIHWMLAGIHPFIDGNGRTSRLLMNLILMRNGYFIANLKGDLSSRSNYYKDLEAAQVDKTPDAFRNLVIKTVKEGLEEYLSLIVPKKKK
jgi:Fic family protein